MTRQDKRAMMLTLVEQWQQSGMSQAEFARVQNLTLVKFRYWIRRYKQQNDAVPGFIQLNGFTGGDISIRYPNGVELGLPAQTPVGVIRSLINY
jgi:hypothetical protein